MGQPLGGKGLKQKMVWDLTLQMYLVPFLGGSTTPVFLGKHNSFWGGDAQLLFWGEA